MGQIHKKITRVIKLVISRDELLGESGPEIPTAVW